jgi:hypothetical protein
MTIKLGITLAVVALVTSGTGCGKQKPESGTVEATKDSTSAAAVSDTSMNATNASLQWGPGARRVPRWGKDGCGQRRPEQGGALCGRAFHA